MISGELPNEAKPSEWVVSMPDPFGAAGLKSAPRISDTPLQHTGRSNCVNQFAEWARIIR